jgi:hypothetical protein
MLPETQHVEPKKELTDFDLDISNALKDFPSNNEDAYIYIRGGIDFMKANAKKGFVSIHGTPQSLSAAVMPAFFEYDICREVILKTVLNFLAQSKKDADNFVKLLGYDVNDNKLKLVKR